MKKVLFLGRFPPPTHGASIMNESYFNGKEMNKNFELRRIKINYFDKLDEMGSVSTKKFLGVFAVFFKLLKELISFNPDLIYFEIPVRGIAFIRDSIYALECKLFGKKIIFQTHTKGLKFSRYAKFVFGNSKMIILSPLLYDEVSAIFDKEHVYFVPNGINDQLDDKKFRTILSNRKNEKELTLLFLSNMYETKGSLDVLRICNSLKNKIKFKCLFVGNFPDKETEKKWFSLRKEYGLERECVYLGPKFGKDKEQILGKANFLIFPTQYENESFPLVILESFMFGIPVLSYDTGAIKEIVSKDFLGYVANPGDWNELTEKLKIITKNKIESNKIRQFFKKNFQFEVSEKKLIEIFNKEI
jgi:glycosyltransferase involved in cell wall biosynthesis